MYFHYFAPSQRPTPFPQSNGFIPFYFFLLVGFRQTATAKRERSIELGLHHLFSLNLEGSTSYGTLCPKKVGLGESGVSKGR